MKNFFSFLASTSLVCFILFSTSCKKNDPTPGSISNQFGNNALFSELYFSLKSAGLVSTLDAANASDPSGNFTIFAPNNAALGGIGLRASADIANINADFLKTTLLYHVSNGSTPSSAVKAGVTLSSLANVNRRFVFRGTDPYINGSKIIATDLAASNGVIHTIDKVLLASGADIVATVSAFASGKVLTTPDLTYLLEAVTYADLANTLKTTTGFTIYAPNDAAFIQLGKDLGVTLTKPADIRGLPVATIKAVLLNHAIADGGKFTSELSTTTGTTAGTGVLTYGDYTNGSFTVLSKGNKVAANMTISDIQTTNGVIHIIDRVLLP